MPIYDKPVTLLFREFLEQKGLKPNDIFTRKDVVKWFGSKYPKIKESTIVCHLTKFSTNMFSRIHYNAGEKDDLLFRIAIGKFRLYDRAKDPTPIYKREDAEESIESIDETSEAINASEFAYERDLQNFLSKNLHLVEDGLTLYEDEGITGIEFPAGNRSIDILARDKNNDFVVLELKVSRGYDRVVGQLLRYIAWIEKNLAEEEKVKGIIIAKEISEDLKLAVSKVRDVKLFEYELAIKLKEVVDIQ